jgi:hypothetical protein
MQQHTEKLPQMSNLWLPMLLYRCCCCVLLQAWQFEDYSKEDLLAITREAARKK